MASGVPPDVFAREIGLTTKDLMWLAAKDSRKMEGDATRMWTLLMDLLNRKMGEIMELRLEIEKREARAREQLVARRMQQESGRGR